MYAKLTEYFELMEQVKLKEALKVCMAASSLCNLFMQEQKPWDMAKTDKTRCAQVVFSAVNALRLLAAMLEPFMPSFSAKVYEQMKLLPLSQRDRQLLKHVHGHPELLTTLVPAGHQIGEPQPIFREIAVEEIEKWRAAFGGKE